MASGAGGGAGVPGRRGEGPGRRAARRPSLRGFVNSPGASAEPAARPAPAQLPANRRAAARPPRPLPRPRPNFPPICARARPARRARGLNPCAAGGPRAGRLPPPRGCGPAPTRLRLPPGAPRPPRSCTTATGPEARTRVHPALQDPGADLGPVPSAAQEGRRGGRRRSWALRSAFPGAAGSRGVTQPAAAPSGCRSGQVSGKRAPAHRAPVAEGRCVPTSGVWPHPLLRANKDASGHRHHALLRSAGRRVCRWCRWTDRHREGMRFPRSPPAVQAGLPLRSALFRRLPSPVARSA